MRTRLSRLFGVFLTAAAVFGAPYTTTRAQETTVAGSPADLADSDGDGLLDRSDPHPWIAEIQGVSWQIRPLKLGWKWDAALESVTTNLSEVEKSLLKQSSVSFGADAEARGDLTTTASVALSLNPMKVFQGTGAVAEFKSRFGISGNANWNRSSQDRASQMRRLIEQNRVAQSLSGMNLEFTVEFFNRSEFAFVGENLQIPIKTADGDVATFAQPWGANGPEPVIQIPARRGLAIPIRFRAELNTSQSMTLLETMETAPPIMAFEETQGRIVSHAGDRPIDAIASLIEIQRKTVSLTAEDGNSSFTWRVARRDETTGKVLTLADAFGAINALGTGQGMEGEPLFSFTNRYLRSAVGRDNSVSPARWWVISTRSNPSAETDVRPKTEMRDSVVLRSRPGFPAQMQHWVEWAEEIQQSEASGPVKPSGGQDSLAWILSTAAKVIIEQDEARAVELWQRAADLEDLDAMGFLAEGYAYGRYGLTKDDAKAVELWQKAADLGDPESMGYLGKGYVSGRYGLAKYEARAVELWQRAASLGDPVSMAYLGYGYSLGRYGLTKDEAKAVEFWHAAASLGDPESMAYLGYGYSLGRYGLTVDETKGVEFWQAAADLGDARSMGNLGEGYALGLYGLAKDEAKGIELLQKAADLGNARSMGYLGEGYTLGLYGLAKDEAKGIELLKKAINFGDVEAMGFMGLGYLSGSFGLIKDSMRGWGLLEKAAHLGDAGSTRFLGEAHKRGDYGLPQDAKKAAELLRRAEELDLEGKSQ